MAGRTAPKPPRDFGLDFTPMRRIRSYNLLSMKQLALHAGVDYATIWRLETNKHKSSPMLKEVVAIARALSVPIHDLYLVTDPEKAS